MDGNILGGDPVEFLFAPFGLVEVALTRCGGSGPPKNVVDQRRWHNPYFRYNVFDYLGPPKYPIHSWGRSHLLPGRPHNWSDGTRLPTDEIRMQPRFVGTDGCIAIFFGQFDNFLPYGPGFYFFGMSSAAKH